jgi:voltage-gated potassium channel
MPFFLGFLVLATIVLPVVSLSQLGRLALALAFALMLIFGTFATIRHRAAIYLVVGLTISTFAVDLIIEIGRSDHLAALDTALKVACLSIMFCMTLKRTLRPGKIDGYRVLGGIAGYLLIGLVWTFAYQLLIERGPSAIHFEPGVAENLPGQPNNLMYFSFITLTTVGFGDVHPVTPAARALAMAEALVGQLYIAILIASLVGMALQARSSEDEVARTPMSS